jgi:hypothetical protein
VVKIIQKDRSNLQEHLRRIAQRELVQLLPLKRETRRPLTKREATENHLAAAENLKEEMLVVKEVPVEVVAEAEEAAEEDSAEVALVVEINSMVVEPQEVVAEEAPVIEVIEQTEVKLAKEVAEEEEAVASTQEEAVEAEEAEEVEFRLPLVASRAASRSLRQKSMLVVTVLH